MTDNTMVMPPNPPSAPATSRPFLGVNFARCRVYARLYRNPAGTMYVGRCPRCAARVEIPIGSGGTSQRFFIYECP